MAQGPDARRVRSPLGEDARARGASALRLPRDRWRAHARLSRDPRARARRLERGGLRFRPAGAAGAVGREAPALFGRHPLHPPPRKARAAKERRDPRGRLRTPLEPASRPSRSGARRGRRMEDFRAVRADREVPLPETNPHAGLRLPGNGPRPVPGGRGFRLPLARGGGRLARPRRPRRARAAPCRGPPAGGGILVGGLRPGDCRRARGSSGGGEQVSAGVEERESGRESGAPRRPRAPVPFRVGIDARELKDYGIGSYIRNLLEASGRRPESRAYRFRVYAHRSDADALPELPGHFEVVHDDSPGYSVAELTSLPWRLLRDRLDLFHATHYVLPPLWKTRAVVTIHDIIHLLYPQFLPNRAAHVYARFMIRRALKRADRIVTVSYNTRRDLVDYFGIPAARIEVIYNGVSPRFRPDIPREEKLRVAGKLGISFPYLLFLGGEKPHKNVRNVVRAFGKARREHSLPHALVLAGPLPPSPARLEALIAALDISDTVHRPGIVDEADLPALYAGADAFLYPTLYEGFGLPVVEAMGCGTPVLTSSTSALKEIAGGHALLVDPMDVDAISAGIGLLATDANARAEYIALGRKRALDFSWDKAAQRTLEVYASALGAAADRKT